MRRSQLLQNGPHQGLVALAREIDIRWKAEHLNEEDLRKDSRS